MEEEDAAAAVDPASSVRPKRPPCPQSLEEVWQVDAALTRKCSRNSLDILRDKMNCGVGSVETDFVCFGSMVTPTPLELRERSFTVQFVSQYIFIRRIIGIIGYVAPLIGEAMFNDVVIAARLFAQASVKSPPKLEDGRTERKEGRGGTAMLQVFLTKCRHRTDVSARQGWARAAGHSGKD